MLFESFGLHGIANSIVLTGDPDPMPVIYQFFSMRGSAEFYLGDPRMILGLLLLIIGLLVRPITKK